MRQEVTKEIKNSMEDYLRDIHTVLPGTIVSFDPDKCMAHISPKGKYRKPDGTKIDFPDIFEVPVMFWQGFGQTASIIYPVRPDDECLIFFAEQALDLWRTGAESDTDIRFDISNAIALVGFFARPNPLVRRSHDNESIIIQRADTFIELSPASTNITAPQIIINGQTTFNGDITHNGNLTRTGNTTQNGTLSQNGDITHSGSMTTTGTHTDNIGGHCGC